MKLPNVKQLIIRKLAKWSKSLMDWSAHKAKKKVIDHEVKFFLSSSSNNGEGKQI